MTRADAIFGTRNVDLTSRPAQRKTWNLAGLFRLPTAGGPVWLKAVPPFAAAEHVAIAQVDPGLVPTVLASAPGRLLLADVPGTDCWDASTETVADAVHRMATAQARIDQPPHVYRTDVRRFCPPPFATCSTAPSAPN